MGSSHAVLHGMYKLLAREGVASKWFTQDLRYVSLGLLLHGRLPQLLCQLPHPVLHPLQEDLPQHHAGLGKDVHFLALPPPPPPHPPHTFKSLFLSLHQSATTVALQQQKAPRRLCSQDPVSVLCSHTCVVWVEMGLSPSLFSLQTPNWTALVWTCGKVLEGDGGLGLCREREAGDGGRLITLRSSGH